MKRNLFSFRHSLLGAALLLTASLASPGAQAACGLKPGQLMDEILAAAQQTPANLAADPNFGTRYLNQNGVPKWRNCLDPDFKTWRNGGSFNLPVIAAAVGLFREPNRLMPWPSGGTSPNTYVQWWIKFLGPQTGAVAAPADTPRLRYFKASEPFSNIYDGSVVTSVISVRFWAQVRAAPTNATLLDYTKRYLRAQWAVSALAAGTGPAKWYKLDGRTATTSQTQTPARDTQYSPWAPLKSNGTPKYPGHFLALPGARSDLGHWTADDRAALFDRAIEWPVSYTNEHQSQRAALIYFAPPRWPTGAAESLYGVNSADRTFLRNLVNTGAGAEEFVTPGAAHPWLATIRTIKTFRLLGWAQSPSGAAVQFRASNMEGNPNGNTTCMYGVSYDPSTATPTASFLFPFYDRHGAPREGRSWLEPGLMWATYPNDGVHPGGTVQLPLPTTQPLFHIVLSAEAAPFDEKAAPVFFPTYEPFDPWPFDPQPPDTPPDDDWPPEV